MGLIERVAKAGGDRASSLVEFSHSHSQTHTLVCTHHSWQQQPHVVMQDNQRDLDF